MDGQLSRDELDRAHSDSPTEIATLEEQTTKLVRQLNFSELAPVRGRQAGD
jgi:hypothetical protein